MNGKTIKLFLAEGTPSGVMTAEILNWTGKAIVCPRSQLADLTTRAEAKKSGVYFLIGEDLEAPMHDIVYVGESENVLDRLKIHNKDQSKDYWTKTIIFISKDANLTKGHIRYIESRFIQILSQANRAKLDNGTNPDYLLLPEPDIADMEYFIEQIKLMLPILGFSFALPLTTLKSTVLEATDPEIQIESPVLEMNYAGTSAVAQEINGEFIVFKDSRIRKLSTPTLHSRTLKLRQAAVEQGQLIESDPEFWTLVVNIPFSSPSGAADFVGGASLNGRTHWKVMGSKQTYAEWQESNLK